MTKLLATIEFSYNPTYMEGDIITSSEESEKFQIESLFESLPPELNLYLMSFLRPSAKFSMHYVSKHFIVLPLTCVKSEVLDDSVIDDNVALFEFVQGIVPVTSWFVMINTMARKGALTILKSYYHYAKSANICQHAANGGHIHVLEWLRCHGHELGTPIYWNAINHGHLHVVKWLHENKVPRLDSAIDSAARSGQFEILKWIHEQGIRMTHNTYVDAMMSGSMKILTWLEGFDYIIPATMGNCGYFCTIAAKHNHLEVLKHLRELGFPWMSEVTLYAADNGNLELLQWSLENSCPLDSDCYSTAATSGQLHILKYCYERGYPWPSDMFNRVFVVARLKS